MSIEKLPKKKFLVIDYDGCAVINHQAHKNVSLSPKLIKHAMDGDYEGFYGCTHRCYSVQSIYIPFQKMFSYENEAIMNNLTYKVTENFQTSTGLSCMAVSTLDDALYSDCGSAYDKIIKPYEKNGILPKNAPYISISNVLYYYGSKNSQLTQIALHSKKRYPENFITLDYMDDRLYLCNNALDFKAEPNWPDNVAINVFNHQATSDNSSIVPIYKTSNNTYSFYRFFLPFRSHTDTNSEIQTEAQINLTSLQARG